MPGAYPPTNRGPIPSRCWRAWIYSRRPGSVVCPDDISNRKPHPESLYRNCRDLHCAPHEAIYVGDHLRDIEAGRRAGMYTIAAAYGYIEPGDDPLRWGANAQAQRSDDLLELILGPQ